MRRRRSELSVRSIDLPKVTMYLLRTNNTEDVVSLSCEVAESAEGVDPGRCLSGERRELWCGSRTVKDLTLMESVITAESLELLESLLQVGASLGSPGGPDFASLVVTSSAECAELVLTTSGGGDGIVWGPRRGVNAPGRAKVGATHVMLCFGCDVGVFFREGFSGVYPHGGSRFEVAELLVQAGASDDCLCLVVWESRYCCDVEAIRFLLTLDLRLDERRRSACLRAFGETVNDLGRLFSVLGDVGRGDLPLCCSESSLSVLSLAMPPRGTARSLETLVISSAAPNPSDKVLEGLCSLVPVDLDMLDLLLCSNLTVADAVCSPAVQLAASRSEDGLGVYPLLIACAMKDTANDRSLWGRLELYTEEFCADVLPRCTDCRPFEVLQHLLSVFPLGDDVVLSHFLFEMYGGSQPMTSQDPLPLLLYDHCEDLSVVVGPEFTRGPRSSLGDALEEYNPLNAYQLLRLMLQSGVGRKCILSEDGIEALTKGEAESTWLTRLYSSTAEEWFCDSETFIVP